MWLLLQEPCYWSFDNIDTSTVVSLCSSAWRVQASNFVTNICRWNRNKSSRFWIQANLMNFEIGTRGYSTWILTFLMQFILRVPILTVLCHIFIVGIGDSTWCYILEYIQSKRVWRLLLQTKRRQPHLFQHWRYCHHCTCHSVL